jgi:hypothetical protein
MTGATRASNLTFVLTVVLTGLSIIASELRPASAGPSDDANCEACLMEGGGCLKDPDGTFRGCCHEGSACYGPDGKALGCCAGVSPLCDATRGTCVAQCPPGSTTTELQSKVGGCCPPGMFYDQSTGHCLKSTHCPKWLDAYGGKCLPHCAPGMRRNLDGKCVARCTAGLECGAACCPAGQQCARPAAPVVGQQQPKCCPQGQVCGPLCMDDLKYIGAHCCGSGPAAGWAKEGEECCGGVPCGRPNRLPR